MWNLKYKIVTTILDIYYFFLSELRGGTDKKHKVEVLHVILTAFEALLACLHIVS